MSPTHIKPKPVWVQVRLRDNPHCYGKWHTPNPITIHSKPNLTTIFSILFLSHIITAAFLPGLVYSWPPWLEAVALWPLLPADKQRHYLFLPLSNSWSKHLRKTLFLKNVLIKIFCTNSSIILFCLRINKDIIYSPPPTPFKFMEQTFKKNFSFLIIMIV